jgi:hypothetical protein
MDVIYGCDTCRTTIGRAGCPTHRDSAVCTDRHEWSSASTPVLTHCIHGLDLRLHPRCYLCRPASDEQVTSKCDHAALVAAARVFIRAWDYLDKDWRDTIDAVRAALDGEPQP